MANEQTTKANRTTLYHNDIFQHKGYSFRFELERDDCMGEPWKEHDGHGIVSDWTSRDKEPGERILAQDRYSYRYYDITETLKLAKKDGWGAGDKGKQALAARLGRKPTKRELTALAVQEDFEHMKGWCDDEWYWVYVRVVMLKEDEDADGGHFDTHYFSSLGGIESEDDDYVTETAYELASEVISEFEEKGARI